MWKPIIVGIICGAAIAIGLGLFDGYQKSKKDDVQQVNTSVASAAYGVTYGARISTGAACSDSTSCETCLDTACFWAPVAGCLDSCSVIADTACFDPQYFEGQSTEEICATDVDLESHHTMKECVDVGYYYYYSSYSSGKAGKGYNYQHSRRLSEIMEDVEDGGGWDEPYSTTEENDHAPTAEEDHHDSNLYEGKTGKGSKRYGGYGKAYKQKYYESHHNDGTNDSGLYEYCTLECETYITGSSSDNNYGYDKSGKYSKGNYYEIACKKKEHKKLEIDSEHYIIEHESYNGSKGGKGSSYYKDELEHEGDWGTEYGHEEIEPSHTDDYYYSGNSKGNKGYLYSDEYKPYNGSKGGKGSSYYKYELEHEGDWGTEYGHEEIEPSHTDDYYYSGNSKGSKGYLYLDMYKPNAEDVNKHQETEAEHEGGWDHGYEVEPSPSHMDDYYYSSGSKGSKGYLYSDKYKPNVEHEDVNEHESDDEHDEHEDVNEHESDDEHEDVNEHEKSDDEY